MAIDDNKIYGLSGAQIKDLPGKIDAVKGLARELTSADYDYPTNNPDGVALWLLPDGTYTGVGRKYTASGRAVNSAHLVIVATSRKAEHRKDIVYLDASDSLSPIWKKVLVGVSDGHFYSEVSAPNISDSLTSTSTKEALSANQGRVLKGMIDAITGFSYEVVQTLPASGENGKIYLVPIDESGGPADNIYEEYIWVNNAWEMIGTTEMDLSNYVTFTDLSSELADYTPTASLATVATSGSYTDLSNTPTVPSVVQTTGTSTTDVMSQDAVTSMVFADPADKYKVQIGAGALSRASQTIAIGRDAWTNANGPYAIAVGGEAIASGARSIGIGNKTSVPGTDSVAIGAFSSSGAVGGIAIGSGDTSANGAKAQSDGSIAIGYRAKVISQSGAKGQIALGAYSEITGSTGTMNIGSSNTDYGYNNSQYRLLTGLYDPQSAHDAATKGYVDNSIPATFTTNEWNALWA